MARSQRRKRQKTSRKSLLTTMGHLKQSRRNVRSTKPKTDKEKINDFMVEQVQEPGKFRTNHVFTACREITGKIATDQTGRFLVTSRMGNSYVFILLLIE